MDDERRVLSDDEVTEGSFCKVVAGPHQGRYGVLHAVEMEDVNGQPLVATVRTRDDNDEYLSVRYEHIRPDAAGKR